MNILILRSSFQTDEFVRNEYSELLQRIENECRAEIHIIGDESVETHGRASLRQLPCDHINAVRLYIIFLISSFPLSILYAISAIQ